MPPPRGAAALEPEASSSLLLAEHISLLRVLGRESSAVFRQETSSVSLSQALRLAFPDAYHLSLQLYISPSILVSVQNLMKPGPCTIDLLSHKKSLAGESAKEQTIAAATLYDRATRMTDVEDLAAAVSALPGGGTGHPPIALCCPLVWTRNWDSLAGEAVQKFENEGNASDWLLQRLRGKALCGCLGSITVAFTRAAPAALERLRLNLLLLAAALSPHIVFDAQETLEDMALLVGVTQWGKEYQYVPGHGWVLLETPRDHRAEAQHKGRQAEKQKAFNAGLICSVVSGSMPRGNDGDDDDSTHGGGVLLPTPQKQDASPEDEVLPTPQQQDASPEGEVLPTPQQQDALPEDEVLPTPQQRDASPEDEVLPTPQQRDAFPDDEVLPTPPQEDASPEDEAPRGTGHHMQTLREGEQPTVLPDHKKTPGDACDAAGTSVQPPATGHNPSSNKTAAWCSGTDAQRATAGTVPQPCELHSATGAELGEKNEKAAIEELLPSAGGALVSSSSISAGWGGQYITLATKKVEACDPWDMPVHQGSAQPDSSKGSVTEDSCGGSGSDGPRGQSSTALDTELAKAEGRKDLGLPSGHLGMGDSFGEASSGDLGKGGHLKGAEELLGAPRVQLVQHPSWMYFLDTWVEGEFWMFTGMQQYMYDRAFLWINMLAMGLELSHQGAIRVGVVQCVVAMMVAGGGLACCYHKEHWVRHRSMYLLIVCMVRFVTWSVCGCMMGPAGGHIATGPLVFPFGNLLMAGVLQKKFVHILILLYSLVAGLHCMKLYQLSRKTAVGVWSALKLQVWLWAGILCAAGVALLLEARCRRAFIRFVRSQPPPQQQQAHNPPHNRSTAW